MTKESAHKAWRTMRGPVWKARRSAGLSQKALEAWAKEAKFRLVFLDAESGNPRTGIVDAVLIRIRPKSADQLDLYVVQLKGGSAGLKPAEMKRLKGAAAAVEAKSLVVLHDGKTLQFLEPTSGEAHTAPPRRIPSIRRKPY
jgi:hypothetical protein